LGICHHLLAPAQYLAKCEHHLASYARPSQVIVGGLTAELQEVTSPGGFEGAEKACVNEKSCSAVSIWGTIRLGDLMRLAQG